MVAQNFLLFALFLLPCIYLVNSSKEKLNAENLQFYVLPESCFTQLTTERWLDFPCLKFVVSKMIGFAIVILATIAKLPQIIKILRAGDITGVSFSAQYLETITYAFCLSYNLHKNTPFSTFGEIPFLILQNFAIFILFAVYDKKMRKYQIILAMIIFFIIFIIFLLQLVPEVLYTGSMILTIILNLFSRLPQIFLSFTEKSTGQLSFITYFLYFGGGCARLFTLLVETDDRLYQYAQLQATILLGIMIFQIIYFWNNTNDKLKKVSEKTD